MRQAWTLYLRLISIRIRSQMQYRTSFLLDFFSNAVVVGVSFLTLALILQKFDGLGGWKLWEVAFLYGMVEIAFGLMDMIFSGFDPSFFGNRVRLGAFDQMLLKPAPIVLQVFGSEFVLRRLGRVTEGLIVLTLAIANLEIHWTIVKALYIPVVIAGMVCFFGGLFVVGATITFWTIEAIEVINIFTYGGNEMMSYPMHIYPDWMRQFFTFIVPGIFMNYYPALYILGKADPFGLPAFAPWLAPFVGIAVLAASLRFLRFGLAHYQSAGT